MPLSRIRCQLTLAWFPSRQAVVEGELGRTLLVGANSAPVEMGADASNVWRPSSPGHHHPFPGHHHPSLATDTLLLASRPSPPWQSPPVIRRLYPHPHPEQEYLIRRLYPHPHPEQEDFIRRLDDSLLLEADDLDERSD